MGNIAESKKLNSTQKKRIADYDKQINGNTFIKLRTDLINHPRFKHLSPEAVCTFYDLLAKYKPPYFDKGKRHNGNNGDLSLTYSESRFSRPVHIRAMKELEDNGFIIKTRQGGTCHKVCNLYALTCFPLAEIKKLNQKATHSASDDWKKLPL